ncbi:thiol peroxidase [Pseudoglutamicibacter albus]|uniref:thiol peroxidase n=1 Tax=Pseudoglutamicibacter TaxID=1742991 RepID=UPI000C774384|nr:MULTISPECIES: thiol peroxidase [Pseudoglutamicibacter]MCT1686621.1 thiol peroxidase [Pseudoglutamicibacter cumminsii]MDK7082832.1 thiol peroxidase [Pseudoglutamicibacter cumminsii]PKY80389.1 thiol peroxidase [Pseudoglutamicibacter albus]WIK84759.1 thiol peroxidase [Pseudoglutamicibacter albus]
MATIEFQGKTLNTVGDLPAVGQAAPEFTTVNTDLEDVTLKDYAGKRVVLNVFPSIDTGVCAQSVREFNKRAASLDNTVVVTVSMDLPFALGRFCGAEGIDNVVATSAFRSSFGEDYGIKFADGPMKGLMARGVIVIDTDGSVLYSSLTPSVGEEPAYDEILNVL